MVDDERAIRQLLVGFLSKRGYATAVAGNAAAALGALDIEDFDLVLSDVRMPGMDGIALLGEIRKRFPGVAVLLLTGCEDVSMAVGAMKAGAFDYVLKPVHLERVGSAVETALRRRRDSLAESARVRELEETVARQTTQLRHLLTNLEASSYGTLDALVAALDAREHETQSHSRRVAQYTVLLAREMGVSGVELEIMYQGAMLHDIGKIGVSDNILLKPSALTEGEWAQMRLHPQIGYWILQGVEKLRPAADLVLAHHERIDGCGYPMALADRQIPLGARIFSVVDTLDAITSDRPYHTARSLDFARKEIAAHSGTQLDPEVVDRFLAIDPSRWIEIRDRTLAETGQMVTNLPRLVLDECRLNDC